ncbi:MAG: aldo/keto reductase [Trueperaceae bacterium]|nr:MAG: aldo/keto reductase [Trueperaceae bacterium]
MNTRVLGKTGYNVSEVGFGAWAIGADWGSVSEDDALAALREALDRGVTFIDTADVYGDGRSERLIAQILKDFRGERIYVATKAGRRLDPHVPEGYNYENLAAFTARSLENLQVETLDLVQLHCPPTDVYRRDDTFEAMDRLKREGVLRHYGVSVETVEEAELSLAYPGVASVQIIYNMFRLKPALEFFAQAREHEVGIIARVPLASGLLSGKMTAERTFPQDDHRNYNRQGEAFDIGETFSGVTFETGLQAVEELKELVPEGRTLAQLALRWILMHPAVSTVIPGAKRVDQVEDNVQASEMPALAPSSMQRVRDIYDRTIRDQVHHRW